MGGPFSGVRRDGVSAGENPQTAAGGLGVASPKKEREREATGTFLQWTWHRSSTRWTESFALTSTER